jgi:hypothetical protein
MSTKPQGLSTGGLRLIGQGREAEVFECPDGRVLKLLRASGPRTGLAFEIAALEAARTAGVSVAQVYEEVVIDGRTGLMMERLTRGRQDRHDQGRADGRDRADARRQITAGCPSGACRERPSPGVLN